MLQLEGLIQNYFGIPSTKLETVGQLFKPKALSKGDFLIKKNSYSKNLSFVSNGYLRVFDSTHKQEVTQWIACKDHFLTDLASLIFDIPARWNIQALTDCALYTISKEDYQSLQHLVPEWERLEKYFIAKCFCTLEERVFSFLSMSAKERFDHLFQSNPELFNHVPLHYIASMLGMTPETLSRIRNASIS